MKQVIILCSVIFFSFPVYSQMHGNAGGGEAEIDSSEFCQSYEKGLWKLEESFLNKHNKKMSSYSDFTSFLIQIALVKLVNGAELPAEIYFNGCENDDTKILATILTSYQDELNLSRCPVVFKERTSNVNLLIKIIDETKQR